MSGGRCWVGYNFAFSWVVVVMVGLGLGLGASGYLMIIGVGGDMLKDVHELMVNAFFVVVLLYVGGVAVHVLWYCDHLYISMVMGRKLVLSSDQVLVCLVIVVGIGFVVLFGLAMGYLLQYYDVQVCMLDLFGISM